MLVLFIEKVHQPWRMFPKYGPNAKASAGAGPGDSLKKDFVMSPQTRTNIKLPIIQSTNHKATQESELAIVLKRLYYH